MRGERVPKRAAGEKRNRTKREQSQLETDQTHPHEHDDDLEDGHHSLLNAVDQHALNRSHILEQARHQISGCAIVEPLERQELNVRIQIATQIEDYALLES